MSESETSQTRESRFHWADLLLTFLIVLVFSGVSFFKLIAPGSMPWINRSSLMHVGAEYNCIAKAIANGRGFSDPFFEPSGPTAWMPPALSYYQAFVYQLTGNDDMSLFFAMVLLNLVSVSMTSYLLLRESRRLGYKWAGLVVVLLLFTSNFFMLFQMTHDPALLLIVVNLVWIGANRLPRFQRSAQYAWWGVLGGGAALCSPIVGGAWGWMTLRQWRKEALGKTAGRSKSVGSETAGSKSGVARHFILALVVGLLLVTPWTVRNRLQFGKWMPIKSNGLYELWQSQVIDDDGILDNRTFAQHPWAGDREQRAEYLEMGEVAFVQEKTRLGIQAVIDAPLAYLEKVGNRCTTILLYYIPTDDIYPGDPRAWALLYTRLIHPLPLLALLLIACCAPIPLEARLVNAIVLFAVLMFPYALLTYYDRYGVMCIGIKGIVMLYGWDAFHNRFFSSKQESQADASTDLTNEHAVG